MNQVRVEAVTAPAKINLALRVGSRQADGFHPLNSLFHAIDLPERVTVRALDGPEDRLTVTGLGAAGVPLDASNLALAAAARLRAAAGIRQGAAIAIEKGIPVAGGLAGGSADAAAALAALNRLWGLGYDLGRLIELGLAVGSDVPFALMGGSAIGTGRGEHLTPVAGQGRLHWVLLTSRQGLSTPAVFRQFDAMVGAGALTGPHAAAGRGGPPPIPEALVAGLTAGDPAQVGTHLVNDLQPAALALRPELADGLAAALAAGALGAVVSGSGPTIAALAAGPDQAAELAATLAAQRVCDAVLTATGPAPGAY
ncbi:MAG: 4-(cytidine 5'-diphospho)-2-C-methyl-D-erythritol kinase [Bifidobacteriaceae bacterium]|jgi:4-diphosphocytidyl-2-C-methyl-D-erythritol kinase|nr:4-(cytidine 5'-diphospho)-2-C-methyl-D-erythritol kinase [Bifidobacteriaceae bacterium]